jgi:molybdopterin/thiamine biosynthesis adenylyltransferase
MNNISIYVFLACLSAVTAIIINEQAVYLIALIAMMLAVVNLAIMNKMQMEISNLNDKIIHGYKDLLKQYEKQNKNENILNKDEFEIFLN